MTAAVEMTPASIEVSVLHDFAAVREEWRALNLVARAGSMFLSPDWLEPWWAQWGEGRELQLICIREGGQLIGFLPLFSEQVRLGGVLLKRVAFVGDSETGCDYMDALAAPGREREIFEQCLTAVQNLEWDLCDLDDLWRESFTAVNLAQRFPNAQLSRGITRDGRLRYVCPHIPLQGTYETYLQGLSRRENLKRREKWLFKQPGTSIECARTPEEAAKATEHFFTLHKARWAAEGGSDGVIGEKHEAFHREAISRLAKNGSLRMYTLFCARRPVASVYGVVFGSGAQGKFNYYQSGYDPEWGSKSVGLVLLARTVSDAFAEGLSEFDFLRGNESYKAEWARGERWTVQLRLWRGMRGRTARAALA
ncbi:MAG TPA: GNAT family N-acetyltransferase, partial [Myxococcales bacterium]|nr:GNAT family N-acetyltransferase [Myxococcales bacterium]